MKGYRGWGAVVSSLVLLAACVHVENVPGPDGETAHLIRCSSSAKCFELASDICGGASYVLRSDNAVSYSALTARSAPSSSTEILVSCKDDLRAASAEHVSGSPVCDEASADAVDCMRTSYRSAHVASCDALLLRLDPSPRNKVDAMFLQAPTSEPPATGGKPAGA